MLALTSMFAQLFERVKVYRLNDGEKWDDKGTGHVSLEYLERSEAVGLVVIDEENNQTLLIHRISADDIYRRQEDTIISWTDPEVATDLALSFQETMSCSYIWDQICSVQRSIQFPTVGALDSVPRPIGDDLEHSGTSQDDDDVLRGGGGEFSRLPPVELGTLPQLVKAVSEVPHFDRDRVAALVLRDPNYLRKIFDLFRVCEDLENLEGLHMMYKTVKGIISLNDGHIFDEIFSDAYIMDVVGALEYDPELPTKQRHREFLKDQVAYKEVVPIRDPAIAAKIHQTYRVGFIKDVILPRVLDDQTFATFNSIMLFNHVQVVTSLLNDSGFINELFSKLWSADTTDQGRRDLILFVQEFCNLSKHLQPGVRNQLLGSLVKEGLFDIITNTLQSSDESVRVSGSDILVVVSNHSPPLLRGFLVEQQGQTLFSLLVKGMLTPGEGGIQSQLLDIMRMLLDADTMDPGQSDKFLDVFYAKYIDQLVEVLAAGCPPKGTSAEHDKQPAPFLGGTVLKGDITPETLMSICELMCFCVQHHRFRIKYYVMRNNVVEKILRLTRRKEKYLVVAAVRFLRTCIASKDEFYNRYLVKNNLFQPVIQSFLANGNRYNLLNSAVLELFDFIRKENITQLLQHLVENYSDKLDRLEYAESFWALKLKYEQSLESSFPNAREATGAVRSGGPDHGSLRVRERLSQIGPMPDLRKRKDERALDKDEEDYFNEDSDEEDDTASAQISPPSPPAPPGLGNGNVLVDSTYRGLVDYDDEDEETPAGHGGNKEASLERRSEHVLLPPLPISDPTWPEIENSPTKRKVGVLTMEDASTLKRRRPENEDVNKQSVSGHGTEDAVGHAHALPMEENDAVRESTQLPAGHDLGQETHKPSLHETVQNLELQTEKQEQPAKDMINFDSSQSPAVDVFGESDQKQDEDKVQNDNLRTADTPSHSSQGRIESSKNDVEQDIVGCEASAESIHAGNTSNSGTETSEKDSEPGVCSPSSISVRMLSGTDIPEEHRSGDDLSVEGTVGSDKEPSVLNNIVNERKHIHADCNGLILGDSGGVALEAGKGVIESSNDLHSNMDTKIARLRGGAETSPGPHSVL